VCLLHDNAQPHTAEKATKLLEKFGWENLEHPPYSPDLAPSNFHLFPKMKEFLGSKGITSD
jgi:transposase